MWLRIMIPIIAGLLFMAGGREQWKWSILNQKWWRWGMGFFIGILMFIPKYQICNIAHMIYALKINYFYVIAPTISFFLATSALSYGDSSWLNKFVSKEVKYVIFGFCFGIASIVIVGVGLALVQAVIGAISFLGLMKLGEKNMLDQKYIEFGIGCLGTCLLIWG